MDKQAIQPQFSRRDFGKRVLAALAVAAIPGIGALARPEEVGAVPLSGVTGVVSSSDGFLSLRKGPSLSYAWMKDLPNGTPLSIVQTSSNWFKVVAGGSTGWVNSWYVSLNGTPSRVITRGNTSRKMIALTFDAGSDRGYIDSILNTLAYYGVPASFGLTGMWIKAYPGDAARIVANGHQVLNHTLDHLSYTGYSTGSDPISPASRLSQIIANESLINNTTGATAKPLWRPPYGDYNGDVLREVGAIQYSRTVMWSIDTMGWNGASAETIYQDVCARAGFGKIVLMHVGAASADAIALPRIIRKLRARGYQFGTVSQVIA
ncbi:MAG TPA: polysaccharide deacetylase family protein [Thermomicrobiales bacterium]|jgi:peptidoglycan/xylan/chitin deacetylase (PgdA/CDA1 family)|nr:polysaccharide deacetylase family protein [Thermomicrobiales bacterium]